MDFVRVLVMSLNPTAGFRFDFDFWPFFYFKIFESGSSYVLKERNIPCEFHNTVQLVSYLLMFPHFDSPTVLN